MFVAAYISHSASRERISYIFEVLLPPIGENVTVLDVGSRLGALLYGVRNKKKIGLEFFSKLKTTSIKD